MLPVHTQEDSRYARFFDLCLLYGDFNRPVFLEASLRWFVESATPSELKSLRHAIRDRTKALRRNGQKGRPRSAETRDWIRSTLKIVWQREILHRTWPQIAAALGMRPTKPNLRTLLIRRDRYAELVWRTLPGRVDDAGRLSKMLDAKPMQRLLHTELALPFETHPRECRRIVLKLAPRGLEAAAKKL